MKVFIDPVYTGKPSTCSTSYLVWEIIAGFLQWRDDVFIYLLYPEKYEDDEEELAFLSRHSDNVTLIPHQYLPQDRVRELFTFNDQMYNLVSPGKTEVWDADVVITSRIPQIPMFRVSSGRPVGCDMGSYRTIIGLDEMPIFSFRKTVLWSKYFDMQQLSAYEMSDGVVTNNLWTYDNLRKITRDILSPSKAKEVLGKMHEAVPVKLERLKTKPKKKLYQDGDSFYVAFTGRATGTRNFKQIAELFRKQYSFPIGKNKKYVKFLISTQSLSFGSVDCGELDFIDIQNNSREEFHKLLKEKAHVVVNLSAVEDFSLSTYEPLYYGVPVVVPNRDWAGFLGEDYPFRTKTFNESYGILNLMISDYAKQYAKFKKWESSTWKDLVESDKNVSTFEKVQKLITDREGTRAAYLNKGVGGAFLNIVDKVIELGPDELDVISFAKEKGLINITPNHHGTPMSRRQNLLILKMLLIRNGYKETNKCGVFVKDKTND